MSPKARRNIPRAPFTSLSIPKPFPSLITVAPPKLDLMVPSPTAGLAGVCLVDIQHQRAPLPGLPPQTPLELVVSEAQHHPRRLAPYLASGTTCHVLGLEGREQDDLVIAGQPTCSLPVELVHQVDDPLPHAGLFPAHPAATLMVGFGIGAADEVVVEPVAEPLDAPEGVLPNLTAVSFGKVREEGANAGVERNHAIAAWGLNGALRRVRNDQPVTAAFPEPIGTLFAPAGMASAIRNGPRIV